MAPPKRPWFRFYVEACADKKLRRLKPETRWLFVSVLAAARQYPTPGSLMVSEDVPMDLDDIADFAALTRRQVDAGLKALTEVGVIAFDAQRGAWTVPKWFERQHESDLSTERAARSRGSSGDATPDATAPEDERTESEVRPVSKLVTPTILSSSPAREDDDRINETWTIMGRRRLDTRNAEMVARGKEPIPSGPRADAWIAANSTHDRSAFGQIAAAYLDDDPTLTTEELADRLSPDLLEDPPLLVAVPANWDSPTWD